MESVPCEDGNCISSECIYEIFMSHSYVQQWLLQSNPPSITEVAFSLSRDPVLFGFEVGDAASPDAKFSIDTAGILGVYQCIDNTALGFGFPYLGRHFSELADQEFRIEECQSFEGCPITRFAIMRIEHLAKTCFISLEFNWSLAGSLVVFTKASYILDNRIENSFFNHFEFRWFSPENALSLCQASAKIKPMDEHFGDIHDNFDADVKRLFLQFPGRVIRFEHYSKGKHDERNMPLSNNEHGVCEPSSSSIGKTVEVEGISEIDISNSAPKQCRSVWEMYQSNFLSYHGSQRTFSFSVQRRRRSFLGMSSVLKENCIYRLNVSTHVVMDNNLENLFRVLRINSSCVKIDQYLVEDIQAKSRNDISSDKDNGNENDIESLSNNITHHCYHTSTNNDIHVASTGTGVKTDSCPRNEGENGTAFEEVVGRIVMHSISTASGEHIVNAENCTHNIGNASQEKISRKSLTGEPTEKQSRSGLKTQSWECKMCGSTIRGKRSNFLRHIRNIHEKARPFRCSAQKCDQSFQSKSNLERHISLVHKRQIYSCEECTRTFKSAEAFETHEKSAHSLPQISYKCPICGGCFSSDSSLKRHSLLVHKT